MELHKLQQQVKELELKNDVTREQLQYQRQIHSLKQELRDLGGLHDFEAFIVSSAVVLGYFCSYLCFLGGKVCNSLDWLIGKQQ